jgi:hypothetical protein
VQEAEQAPQPVWEFWLTERVLSYRKSNQPIFTDRISDYRNKWYEYVLNKKTKPDPKRVLNYGLRGRKILGNP